MNEQQVRAAVEAAISNGPAGAFARVGMSAVMDEIMSAVRDYGMDEYQRGRDQGMQDEREVHFG